MSPKLSCPTEDDLFLPPRLALDLLEGAPLVDTFALVTAAGAGTPVEELLEAAS